MFSEYSYPIICTDNFVGTINFYEDHFNYLPVYEGEGFAVLRRNDRPSVYLAVLKASHAMIPETFRRPVSGMILSYPVNDVDKAYEEFYWEGLTIVSEPANSVCGRRHFFIEDPNGMLVDVAENIQLEHGSDDDHPIEVIFAGGGE